MTRPQLTNFLCDFVKKVCLSILNTWHGRPEEKWNPQNSSFLQVKTVYLEGFTVDFVGLHVKHITLRAVDYVVIFFICLL